MIRSYRPAGIGSTAGGTAVYAETYQYNDSNQRTLRNRSVGGNVGYTYDYQSGQLQTETPVAGIVKNYAYDLIGNRDTMTLDASPVYTYHNTETNALEYFEVNGVRSDLSYDADGNLLTLNGKTFTWDGENRLFKVTYGTTLWQYAYDVLNRRVSEKLKNGSSTVYINKFTYDGYNVHTERRYNGNLQLQSWIGYTWGKDLSDTLEGAGGVGGLLWQTTSAGVRAFPFYDGNGNICGYSDASGTVDTRYLYDGFLNVTQTGTTSYRYQASTKSWNPALGLLEYEFRDYSPELGRWIQEDPIGEDGGKNLYGFVKNNSILYFDILGYWQKVSENVSMAKSGDTLESLAAELTNEVKDSVCLWPVYMSDSSIYPKVKSGDCFDVSNLTATTGPDIILYFDEKMSRGAPVTPAYTTMNVIAAQSNEGGSPIMRMILRGHANPTVIGGTIHNIKTGFNMASYNNYPDPKPTYERAAQRKGPKRCWFTKNAEVWFGGCNTSELAENFATKALRPGAFAYGTRYYTAIPPDFSFIKYAKHVDTSSSTHSKWYPPDAGEGLAPKYDSNWKTSEVWDGHPGKL